LMMHLRQQLLSHDPFAAIIIMTLTIKKYNI